MVTYRSGQPPAVPHVGDPEWEEDIRRLSGLSREFAVLWARHEVADPEPRVRAIVHPKAGPVTFTLTGLQVPAIPEARLLVYTPADERTRDTLPLTRRPAAGPPEPAEPGGRPARATGNLS